MDNVKTAYTDNITWAIKENGELWGLGSNECGKLVDGTEENRNEPQKIMDNVRYVKDGGWYTLAITENDELWGWGDNEYGQLGDGTVEESLYPKKIMDDVKMVESSLKTTFAIKNNGELWVWGNTECMPGPVFVRPLSTPIKLMENVKRVITSGNDIFVINDNDELWGWGSNFTGDMGDGTRYPVVYPNKIMDDVREVLPHNLGVLAIKNRGGNNFSIEAPTNCSVQANILWILQSVCAIILHR